MFDLKTGLPMIDYGIADWFGIYLLSGILFAALIDFTNEMMGSPEEFDWGHRGVMIALWPVFAVVFLISLLRG